MGLAGENSNSPTVVGEMLVSSELPRRCRDTEMFVLIWGKIKLRIARKAEGN